MTSFVIRTFLLAASLTCFIHLATGYALVPGISVPNNTAVPPRREINIFAQDYTSMNIFYLGLSSMQNMSKNQTLSYYQISGIHGVNYAWDGDNVGFGVFGNGYCPHGNVLFSTWHRPYLSLYEKTLLDLATIIVNTFPNGTRKSQHLACLQTWRLPYWDWATNGSIPSVINSKTTVSVTTVVNGVLKNVTISNPLYSYPTDPTDPNTMMDQGPKSKYLTEQTVRNPIVKSNVYTSQPTVTNNNMAEYTSYLQSLVYSAFTQSTDFASFSTMSIGDNSIEAPHGTVHVVCGGTNGHMTYIDCSSFDPIFWLHHANVDRFVALWQAIYPDSFLPSGTTTPVDETTASVDESTTSVDETTTPIDETTTPADEFTEDTELHPFMQTPTQYWTPRLARDTKALGYTYPELINCDQQCVIAAVNRLYGSSSSKKKRAAAATSAPYNEYAAHIKISNAAVTGSFSLKVFLGQPSSNDSNYVTDPSFVGSFDVFSSRNILKSHKKMVRGSVSLTKALDNLVEAGKLTDMTPKAVKHYVKNNFNWILTGGNDGDVDLDGLKIVVVTAEVQPPKNEYAFPKWGTFSNVHRVV